MVAIPLLLVQRMSFLAVHPPSSATDGPAQPFKPKSPPQSTKPFACTLCCLQRRKLASCRNHKGLGRSSVRQGESSSTNCLLSTTACRTCRGSGSKMLHHVRLVPLSTLPPMLPQIGTPIASQPCPRNGSAVTKA